MFGGGFGEDRWVLGGVLSGGLPAIWPRLGLRLVGGDHVVISVPGYRIGRLGLGFGHVRVRLG